MEIINLTTPDQQKPGTPTYRVKGLYIDTEQWYFIVRLRGANGELREIRKDNQQARIRALNTANLSTQSLERRILELLRADGDLAGTISGTPD